MAFQVSASSQDTWEYVGFELMWAKSMEQGREQGEFAESQDGKATIFHLDALFLTCVRH